MQLLALGQLGRYVKSSKIFSFPARMNHPYSTESIGKIAGIRRDAFLKQLNYRFEHVNNNLVRVHIPSLPYEAFDCYGRKVLPWKILSLLESVDHNPGWDPADETDPDGFAMIVTVSLRMEFSPEFYYIETPKYPLFFEISHEYLRRTSKRMVSRLRHADVETPYVVTYCTDVKLDSKTRKPKPYPALWRTFGIPTEPSKPFKHEFPERSGDVFNTEHKIHYSDTDANRHANYTFYVRASYDSFHENIVKKNYPVTAISLMDAGIKTVDVSYKQEAFMGDVVTVASWVDPINSLVYYFELLNNNQTCCMITIEFFPAGSQS